MAGKMGHIPGPRPQTPSTIALEVSAIGRGALKNAGMHKANYARASDRAKPKVGISG